MISNQDLIAAAYAAFNRRDIDAVLVLMHPDVDWPNGMDGGRVHGHDEVREYWMHQWEQIDPYVEPTSIRDDESGETVVVVHQVIRDLAKNILLDQIVHHIYRIENHLITRMDIRPSNTEPCSDDLRDGQSFSHSLRT